MLCPSTSAWQGKEVEGHTSRFWPNRRPHRGRHCGAAAARHRAPTTAGHPVANLARRLDADRHGRLEHAARHRLASFSGHRGRCHLGRIRMGIRRAAALASVLNSPTERRKPKYCVDHCAYFLRTVPDLVLRDGAVHRLEPLRVLAARHRSAGVGGAVVHAPWQGMKTSPTADRHGWLHRRPAVAVDQRTRGGR
jgi:hypothetical protein